MPKKDVQKTIRLTSDAVEQLNIMEDSGIPTMPLIRGLIDAAIAHFQMTGEIPFPVKITLSRTSELDMPVPQNRAMSVEVPAEHPRGELGQSPASVTQPLPEPLDKTSWRDTPPPSQPKAIDRLLQGNSHWNQYESEARHERIVEKKERKSHAKRVKHLNAVAQRKQ